MRGRLKFRVGQIVFAALSADQTLLGFGFPREAREALVASQPETFLMPMPQDLRFAWLRLRLAAVTRAELTEFVVEAWGMTVPKKVWNEYAAPRGLPLRLPRRPTPRQTR